jgi:hypothetical protein
LAYEVSGVGAGLKYNPAEEEIVVPPYETVTIDNKLRPVNRVELEPV